MSAAEKEVAAQPAFDIDAIRAHVQMLHGLVPADANGEFTVFVKYHSVAGPSTHHKVGDVTHMVDSIMSHAATPGANVYCGLQLFRKGLTRAKRGAGADIIAVLGLVCDQDSDTGNVGTMPAVPSYIIETSPGNRQEVFLFTDPVAPGEAAPLAAAMQRATNSDDGTKDLAHVWRVPGTLNWPGETKLKRDRSPDPVAVKYIEPFQGVVYTAGDLESVLADYMKPDTPAGEAPEFSGAVDTSPLMARLSEIGHAALIADGQPDRSKHAARVLEQLDFEDFTFNEAVSICLERPGKWTEYRPTTERLIEDLARVWAKYVVPKRAERDEYKVAVERCIEGTQKRKAAAAQIAAAVEAAAADAEKERAAASEAHKPIPPPLPTMHPHPFTAEAAGGMLSDLSRWITSTAIVPVPELSLSAAVAFLCALFGDKALGPTRSGLQLYFTAVLVSAGGKGHPPKTISTLAHTLKRPNVVSNGDPTSYAAVERILRRSNSVALIMDEFGHTLQDVNSRHTNLAAASIRKVLLVLYDQSDGVFDGRQYASADVKKDDSPIIGPAFTVLSMTTPETLYDGLTVDSLSGGFLSRFVFVTGTPPEAVATPKLNRPLAPPDMVLSAIRSALEEFPKDAGNVSFLKKYHVSFVGDEDGEAYVRWSEVFQWQHWNGWTKRQHDINGRAAENTIRLATIRAISRNPKDPAVSVEDVEWGWGIVYNSINVITDGVQRYMAGSTGEALRKAIVEALRTAPSGDQTLSWSHLLRRDGVTSASRDEVSEQLSWLIETEAVKNLSGDKKPGPRQSFRLLG